MKVWEELSKTVYNQVWDRFYKEFNFRPSVHEEDWPSIHTDKPLLKLGIESLLGVTYSESINADLIQKAIDAFVEISKKGDKIFALDWQHECFYIDPRQLTPEIIVDNESDTPAISFIPDGDYYIFLTKDFENIWFGHPWEKTITIIGSELISAFNKNRPLFIKNES